MSTMPATPEPGTLTTPRAPTVTFRAPYIPRHRKPMSPLAVHLSDDWRDLCERRGLTQAHVARHLLDAGVES